MTRLKLDPALTPTLFCERVRAFVDWIGDLVENRPFYDRQGWRAHVEAYVWEGHGWRETLARREALQQRLRNGEEQAAAEVLHWGHTREMDPADIRRALRSLDALADVDGGEWKRLDEVVARRIASTSKIYATADLDSWTIFDSRVGIALSHAVAAWWRHRGAVDHAELLSFRVPPNQRSASYERRRPPEFKTLHAAASTQSRLSFVYASWLTRCLAERLSGRVPAPDDTGQWRTVHVEMALFVLGLDSRQLTCG
jgi:hypothetical protein